ncbi:unnamed protein product [Cunninghamella blakesleeana]
MRKTEEELLNLAKEIDHLPKKGITFYIKTHQHGAISSVPTKQELDIKELYIYKLLQHLGMGSGVHWFGTELFENSIYIATKGLETNHLTIKKEIIKLDIITRILRLKEVISNKSNILQHNDNKGYVVDFRVSKNE